MLFQKPNRETFEARYWERVKGDEIMCGLCPRACKLNEGQKGNCFVRQNLGGRMVLTTYGKSSGFCIDPIEKKPLNHFYPGSSVLSFGTAGCNLACKFCQNWDISRSKEFDRLSENASPLAIAEAAETHKCKSIALTYNDPVIFLEYARDVAFECRKKNIRVVAVTAGYINPEPRKEFFSFIDAVNVDLKSFTNLFYRKLTGGNLKTVLDTLLHIREKTKAWLEITTLIIPGENDSPQELKKLTKWINKELGKDTPLHFSAFHPDYKMTDRPKTPLSSLISARKIALDEGLRYIYTGNVYYEAGDTTFCPNCGEKLIERSWYELPGYYLSESGSCRQCGLKVPGMFDSQPGTWGNRRKPIRI
ncbi:MAG: AmmeMemoRadiSam system radical SAM enzyme [Deltaproteobacteria bacterium]|nr:AmmeMemoRadiSam system radical SAM enzyme [Deltaproteobacteria bacterium]